MASGHLASYFGAASSVDSFDRVGALARALCSRHSSRLVLRLCRGPAAHRILDVAILRYVDDLFGTEGEDTVLSASFASPHAARFAPQVAEAVGFAVRLLRCLLGADAIAQKNVEHGNPLVVLGVEVKAYPTGFRARPSSDKKTKWGGQIEQALRAKRLPTGAASKLAGFARISLPMPPPPAHSGVPR